MFVLIAGGGRTGAQLARTLLTQNNDVHVVDNRRDVLARIHRELPTEAIYEGSPLNPQVLEMAGIKSADVVAACTTSDEDNLVICYIARSCYGIRRTIARVNDPRNAWLFNGTFNVDVAVNQAEILSRLIEEEMSMGEMVTLLKLRHGKYSFVEEKITTGARAIGIQIKDLGLPDRCVIAGIVRKGEVIVPRGVTVLEEGDEVLAVTDPEGGHLLNDLFSAKGKNHIQQKTNGV
jgi:trk system potassium uptake protein TrkA